jgi:Kef-type K+ transport system membrane component KefB
VENEEDTYFIVMLAILAGTALRAQVINLPGIVGAFLAGLALNAAVNDKPAKSKLEFMSNTLFVPCFFAVTGFLIDPLALARGFRSEFLLAGGLIAALVVGRWVAAEGAGRACGYTSAARKTMWSLTPPQLAATLAAALVATKTVNATGQALIDGRILNCVLGMVLVTAIPGPVLTQCFAPRMLEPGLKASATGDVSA